ncbi:MAG: SDR family NAD(P)-dependent oxidoreductase [SAR86 cluster bacterium]|jgi:NAD(P)-dependent dehydrogenase (short-subunit alcohol dehydrogenase family)|uniref:SDR family NAD(P)-dependent oxidoreductase n=1 Tax=SAR86 cluster bacterium TaxID=2030880 RepID=A0A520N1M2_9GAMM|nr:MAG: SDR family NAD(P)-dependent oxidoreductase [SAR86 cluster bacterium]|tara:strand:- start:87 stop:809 length:723 start_codon:yes stop_codon:yes gene_type:complete
MIKNVAVIGSSGAIGNSISKLLKSEISVESVYNFSRSAISESSEKEKNIYIDIENEDSIIESIKKIPKDIKFDLIFVATGILHNDEDIYPEKSIKDISGDKLKKVLMVNTIGPALIGKYFIPFLNKNNKNVFAFLSARVGSISNNKIGGWYSYRASKSALNQIIKNFSIEIKRSNPNSIFVGLQPGTVKSNLSKPFQKNVNSKNLFSPDYSAKKLIDVINNLSIEDTGKLFAWDGEEIHP